MERFGNYVLLVKSLNALASTFSCHVAIVVRYEQPGYALSVRAVRAPFVRWPVCHVSWCRIENGEIGIELQWETKLWFVFLCFRGVVAFELERFGKYVLLLPFAALINYEATWLILPVVIRSSQRLSHACLSTSIVQ